MAGERTEIAEIREARRMIEKMRNRLLHPSFEALEDCAADLRIAADCIHKLDATLPVWRGAQRKTLEAEVVGLRRGVRCVEALLANAGKFYAGWARLMSGDQAPPNYSAAGSAELAQVSKLVIHG